ncbi:MAG: rhomboid family intramembrane serine protease [Saprospiraceae bacterium]|nr:rhomboid family intramembrane serine protease [Saprospiraceae bacterium]
MTLILIIFISLISIAGFSNREIIDKLMHYPYLEFKNKEWFRLVSGGFVHADWAHLLINMFVLYSFGDTIEKIYQINLNSAFSNLAYILLFLFCIVVGNLPSYFKNKLNPYYSGVGASGATSGLVFVFILFNPFQKIYVFFFPMPGIVFAILYLIYSNYAARQQKDNIGHDAHIAGAIAGLVYTIILIPESLQMFLQEIRYLLH